MKKRIIAIVLSMILCFSCVLPVFAEDGDPDPAPEVTTEETVTEEESTEEPAVDPGFSFDFDISIEDILNSDIILGILGSDGFMDITNIVIELMAMLDKDNLKNMAEEELQKTVQSVFDTVAGVITQIYGNKDLIIKYDPLEVLRNLLDLDEDFLPTPPKDENTTKDPNELVIGPGDVDGDGKITAADARLILRRAAQIIKFTMEQDALADVDKDGKVTAKDARIVLRYCAGMLTDEEASSYGFPAYVK